MADTKGKKLFVRILFVAGTALLLATLVQGAAMVPIIPPTCDFRRIPELQMDTAHLIIINDQQANLSLVLYTQSEECHECDLVPVTTVDINCTVLMDSRWPVRVEVRALKGNVIEEPTPSCSAAHLTHRFLEKGEYSVYIQLMDDTSDVSMECRFALLNSPPDANTPIYVALGLAVLLAVLWVVFKYLYRRGIIHRVVCFWSTEGIMADFGTPTSINPMEDSGNTDSTADTRVVKKKERLRSLDTFRGLSIVIMIFVNYRGGYYWFFQHSKWNGLTVADLVFPWFVFIMGTAMILSFQSQLQRATPKLSMFLKILRRSVILFTLGLLINSGGKSDGIDLSHFRIPGVLQRFAGTYLIVATVHLLFARPFDVSRYGRLAVVRDILEFWPEWVFHLTLVVVHTILTFTLHVPGCPVGYLGAGGLADHSQHMNCTGGAAGYIDRKVFGDAHIYQSPTCKEIYHTVAPYDPEGLLGTLTSVFMCFLGLQAGKILFIHKDWIQRCVRFLIWALVLGLIAGILCKFSKEDGWIPVNKNLWSLTFVLALASMAFFLLAGCYLLIDVCRVWNGAPFYYPGMNPIVLYVGHEILSGRFPVSFDVAANHAAQLAMNLWGTTFWVLVAFYLFYKGIFITV